MNNKIYIDFKEQIIDVLSQIQRIYILFGFSYNACDICNISTVDINEGGLLIIPFQDLQKEIDKDKKQAQLLYKRFISKKVIDDLYNSIERYIFSLIEEFRNKTGHLNSFNCNKEQEEYKKFLAGKFDKSLDRILKYMKKINFSLSDDVLDFFKHLGKIRNSLHSYHILKENINLNYKTIKCISYAIKNNRKVNIDLSNVIDTDQYDKNSIVFEYKKEMVKKVKEFKKGSFPLLEAKEIQDIFMTITEYIIPEIEKDFVNFFKNNGANIIEKEVARKQ